MGIHFSWECMICPQLLLWINIECSAIRTTGCNILYQENCMIITCILRGLNFRWRDCMLWSGYRPQYMTVVLIWVLYRILHKCFSCQAVKGKEVFFLVKISKTQGDASLRNTFYDIPVCILISIPVPYPRNSLGMRPANERRRYIVTSFIGRTHA